MSKIKTIAILAIIAVIGLFLRLYQNTNVSLWHDEAFSILLLKYPWEEMIRRIGLDVHPPMYYIFLRAWNYILGDSLLALRGFSIFFGLGTVIAAYGFVKTAFKNNSAALTAALLIAINPFQIQYATEARMYTFGAFFSILGAYFIVKALETQKQFLDQQHSKRTFLGYYLAFAICMAIIALTHYYLLFTVATLCMYALLYHVYYYRWAVNKYVLLLSAYCVIALSFLPWLKTFIFQYKQVGSGYWIPPIDKWSIPSTIWQMTLGIGIDVNNRGTQALLVATSIGTVYILYGFIRKTASPHKWLTLLGLLAPFAGSMLFLILAKIKGQDSSVYLVRYFLFASTFYTIIIAIWLSHIRTKKLFYLLLIIYAAINIGTFVDYWKDLDVANKPGMNKASRFLQTNVSITNGDKIFVGSSFEFFNLKYYLSTRSGNLLSSLNAGNSAPECDIDCLEFKNIPRPLLYSGGNRSITNLPHFAGTAILTDTDLLPDFGEIANSNHTVWLVWTNGFGGSKPITPTNWGQVDEHGFAEVRPYVGTWIIITQYKIH